ncbi:MAG TPA: hypothetical protein VGX21_22540 [Methylomirabilota bacterium]|nr:hypothetical protein [Methylomirabilota bacterium]
MTAGGTRRGRAGPALIGLLLPLTLLACDKKNNPGGPSDPGERAYLLQHNGRFNSGRTVRWPNLPIRVFLNDIAQESEVTEWTRATGGQVTFTFVGSRSGADVAFRFGGGPDICGLTTVEFDSDGRILSADTQVVQAIFRGPQCQRTVVHETAHAIGFLDHTSDGGLMDPDGGDGRITEPVAAMLRNLYLLAPGTFLGSARGPLAERRPGGRFVVTIVDPVRQ